MLDKKLASILLDSVIVFGGVLLGAKIKDMQHQADLLKIRNKLQEAIIEGQQKIIEKQLKSHQKES